MQRIVEVYRSTPSSGVCGRSPIKTQSFEVYKSTPTNTPFNDPINNIIPYNSNSKLILENGDIVVMDKSKDLWVHCDDSDGVKTTNNFGRIASYDGKIIPTYTNDKITDCVISGKKLWYWMDSRDKNHSFAKEYTIGDFHYQLYDGNLTITLIKTGVYAEYNHTVYDICLQNNSIIILMDDNVEICTISENGINSKQFDLIQNGYPELIIPNGNNCIKIQYGDEHIANHIVRW